jgi:pSer/pThr/pTyr-binding forkhead associated (FHA) protein
VGCRLGDVSKHCEIVQQENGQYLLRDLGGRNGTRVNESKGRDSAS